jgi:hypothetical protein
MVLAGDIATLSLDVTDRLIYAPVSIGEFVSFPARRKRKNLVAKTNSEDGSGKTTKHFPEPPDQVTQIFRITGPIANDDAVTIRQIVIK